jgi:hypothetical protein
MLEWRAVDAVIWGMPIVSLDAMRQAYLELVAHPNTSVRYLYVFFNTKDDGPVIGASARNCRLRATEG